MDFFYTNLFKEFAPKVDKLSCYGMKMYVYDIPEIYLIKTFQDISKHINKKCFFNDCEQSWKTSGYYQYSSELVILYRLLTQCERTKKINEADFFLFPFPFSLWQVSGWIGRRSCPQILKIFPDLLTHMNSNNSHKHVFLDTNDSLFMLNLNKNYSNSIFINYGDDLWSGIIKRVNYIDRKTYYPNSIVVPYRSCTKLKDVKKYNERSILLFGAINIKRNPIRKKIVELLKNKNDKSIIVADMKEFKFLANMSSYAYESKYCLVPAGDAPSLTNRFPSAVISGCIPVRIDPYTRNPPVTNYKLPFFRQLDWQHMHVNINPEDLHDIVNIIRKIKPKSNYFLSKIRNYMKYDLKLQNDASQQTIYEIYLMLFGNRIIKNP